MTYYLESQYLDLRKKYQAFSYEQLDKDDSKKNTSTKGKYNLKGIEQTQQTITQETYQFVKEKDVLINDTSNLCLYFDTLLDPTSSKGYGAKKFPFQMVKDRICHILEKYQEQPALLDVVIQPMVYRIMQSVQSYVSCILKTRDEEYKVMDEFHQIICIIYLLTKVRGHETVSSFFPNEVKILEPLLFYLVTQRENDKLLWETKYVLLLWLSIVVLVPFDLISIDSKIMNFNKSSEVKSV